MQLLVAIAAHAHEVFGLFGTQVHVGEVVELEAIAGESSPAATASAVLAD